jgi:predicted RNase H-like HicB family nuclease
MRRYLVVVEKGPTSWGAYSPDVPGCIAAGKTRAEVVRLFRNALAFHLEGLALAGQPVPKPTASATTVRLAVPAVRRPVARAAARRPAPSRRG